VERIFAQKLLLSDPTGESGVLGDAAPQEMLAKPRRQQGQTREEERKASKIAPNRHRL
jgi:hypothetical protein